MPITAPTINLNGSSPAELRTQYRAAIVAVSAALTAVAETCPHGRDYQTAPPHAAGDARQEHNSRMRALQQTKDELTELYRAVLQQENARARMRNQPEQDDDADDIGA